jgi:hypothetical protein
MRRSLFFLLLAPLLAVALSAQDAKPGERLRGLLVELGKLDATAWAEHKANLEQQASAASKRAAELRAQAIKLQADADAADAAEKAVRVQIARIDELQKLLQDPALKGATTADEPAVSPTPVVPTPVVPAPTEPARTEPAPPAPPTPQPAPPKAAPPAEASSSKASPAVADAAAGGPFITWKGHIERLMQDRCSSCHEPGEKKGGLDVSSFAAIRQGGGSGRTLVAGDPDHSRLWLMISQQERPFMPKGDDQLPAAELQMVRTWIEQGCCEDEAAARTFARTLAAASKADDDTTAAAEPPGAVPENLPKIPMHTGLRPAPIKCLARSPRANVLAMSGLQQVLLFDGELEPIGVLPAAGPHVECAAFAADGSQLAIGCGEPGRSGVVAVHDVHSGTRLGTFGNERDVPLAVAVHAGRGLVALGGASRCATVLRQSDGKQLFAGKHDDFVLCLQFSPDGTLLAAGDRAGTVQLWETDGGRSGQMLAIGAGAVNGLAFAKNGKLLVAALADGTVRGFETATTKELWKRRTHQGPATAVAFGPDDAIASCGEDGRIAVLTRAGKPVVTSNPVREMLYTVAFGTTSDTVFAGDWLGRVHRLSVKSKQLSSLAPLADSQ